MLALSAACVRTRCSPQAGSQPVPTPPSSALSPGNDGRHRMKESASCLLKQRLLSHPPSGSKGLSSASDGWAGATGWLPAWGGPRWDDLAPWSPNHARHSLRRLDYPAAIVGSGMAWCPGPGPAWCPGGGGGEGWRNALSPSQSPQYPRSEARGPLEPPEAAGRGPRLPSGLGFPQ